MASIKFHARQCSFKYANSISIDTSGPLDGDFSGGTAISGSTKDLTLTVPEGAVEMENFLGEDANGFQNAKFNESAFAEGMAEGTFVVEGDEILESLAFGSGTAVTGGFTRYQPGDGSRVLTGALLLNLDNGSEEVNVVLNNVVINIGEIKPTGTDGHWEMGFSAKCLPADFYIEYKD